VSIGRLTVCPTPIGNLDDITLRAIDALRGADLIASEDTRRTRILLERHGIAARPIALHDRNERSSVKSIVDKIEAGERVVLVSDAGTPVVSDPGYVLVRACVEQGIEVEVLPGATAVTTALVLSALPADTFRFTGFLPRRPNDLQRLFSETPDTLVAFESPRRIAASMLVLAELEPDRQVVVCRELTKIHEEAVRGTATEVARHFAEHEARGEITVVVGPPAAATADFTEAAKAVADLVAAGAKPRAAAKAVAGLTGVRANDLYAASGTREHDAQTQQARSL
jgi:16S rRNA (cytidine1402-2'-O)-methyltransferase